MAFLDSLRGLVGRLSVVLWLCPRLGELAVGILTPTGAHAAKVIDDTGLQPLQSRGTDRLIALDAVVGDALLIAADEQGTAVRASADYESRRNRVTSF